MSEQNEPTLSQMMWDVMLDADKARLAAKDIRAAIESIEDDCDCTNNHASDLHGLPEWLEELAVKLEQTK